MVNLFRNMETIFDSESYVQDLMRQGITPDELFSRTVRALYSLEASFLRGHYSRERYTIYTSIAHIRMLYDHCKLMSSAREYLLRKIETIMTKEKELNFEGSMLRNASSGEENRDLSIIGKNFLDHDTILRGINNSERRLSNLGEEIAKKKGSS